jgi:TRAP-type C4-dicarboxylate transport system permease small subunit
VQRNRENVFVSIVTRSLSPRTQCLLDAIAALLALTVFAILMGIAFGRAWEAYLAREFRIAAIQVPIWPFRWLIPLGLALLCLQLLANVIQDWRASRPSRGDFLPEI